jgi:polysaccharide biosynthesis transport protein
MNPNWPIPLTAYDLAVEPLGPHERDLVSPDAVLRLIRRSWRLCAVWIFAGLCAGIAFAMLSSSYYAAFATILLEDRGGRAPADGAGGVAAPDPAYADSQIQVLQSDEVLARVVDKNRLTEVEEFGQSGGLRALVSAVASIFNPGSAATKPTARHATTTRVKRALVIRRLGTSNAVEIGFTSQDAVRSAAIANAIAQSYIDGQLELRRRASEDATAHLKERLAEFRDKAFAIDPPAQEPAAATPEAAEQARARLRELQNRAEIFRALYNNFLQRGYTESVDQFFPGARVITQAEPPTERSWPRMILVLAVAAFGGAAGGIGHALLRQATDHSLRTVEDAQRSTSLERIAGVPKIERQAWKIGEPRQGGLQPAYARDAVTLREVMGKVAVRLQGGQSHRSRSIIAVAAPTDGAGTSSVAAHLARIIAESGQKTLLVDANWRKTSVSQAMLNAQPGRKLARAVATIPLDPESLDVLVLRATDPISELNASLSIVATLQHLQTEYECVVVDFHSVEQTADLEASMTVINEVIVVAEAQRTSSESLHGLLRLVPRDKIAAVVLNKI